RSGGFNRDRDDRGGRSGGFDRERSGGFNRDRDDRGGRSGGFGDRPARSFGDRPAFGRDRDERGGSSSRPFARRDDHRSGGRPQASGGFNRDDRGGRSGGFDRERSGGFNRDDRKPRWKN
ncbi:RNA helicase, partial [Kitasatospora sp. NPDC092286]